MANITKVSVLDMSTVRIDELGHTTGGNPYVKIICPREVQIGSDKSRLNLPFDLNEPEGDHCVYSGKVRVAEDPETADKLVELDRAIQDQCLKKHPDLFQGKTYVPISKHNEIGGGRDVLVKFTFGNPESWKNTKVYEKLQDGVYNAVSKNRLAAGCECVVIGTLTSIWIRDDKFGARFAVKRTVAYPYTLFLDD